MAKEEAPNSDDPPSLVAATTFIQLEHNWPCMLCLLALQPTPVLWAREYDLVPFSSPNFLEGEEIVSLCVPVLLLNLNGTDHRVCIIQIRWGLQGPRIDWRSLKEGAGGAEPVREIRLAISISCRWSGGRGAHLASHPPSPRRRSLAGNSQKSRLQLASR